MNKYRDFRRRDRNPNPASTARQTQRIDKNSSRTARRHKYSNKGRLCVVEPPLERFVSNMHTVSLSTRGYICVNAVKERSWPVVPQNETRIADSYPFRLLYSFFPAIIMFLEVLRVRRLRRDRIDFKLFCMCVKR